MMMLTVRGVSLLCHSQNIVCNICTNFKSLNIILLLFQTSMTTTPHTPIIKASQAEATKKLPFSMTL